MLTADPALLQAHQRTECVVFRLDPNYRIWTIHNHGIDEKMFNPIAASFVLLPGSYNRNGRAPLS